MLQMMSQIFYAVTDYQLIYYQNPIKFSFF